MPDLNDREKALLTLIIKSEFFNCLKCEERGWYGINHVNHRIDVHATYNDIGLWFGYLDLSLIGNNLDFAFLCQDTDNIQLVLDELVAEGFLTPMDGSCGGCGGLVYVRSDTMKKPASAMLADDGKSCRFA